MPTNRAQINQLEICARIRTQIDQLDRRGE